MSYFKSRIVLILILASLVAVSTSYASSNIYTWKAKDGSTVFSQTAPIFEHEYEEVGVHFKNEVQSKSPAEEQLTSLKQNNLYIKEQENPTSRNDNKPKGTLNVKIISPANGESRFIHNEKLSIVLSPTLTAEDHPIFILNGIPTPAHFENGVWKVNRPNPGPVSIAVRGSTKDHQTITSSQDTSFSRKQVFGR
ncbi:MULTISPECIES: DUF4124 domain-containing protein [unclassified Francisella]|uniref:DUF4124 domain-containing protein n=1 Tax=unclassified Francisella TaxID=2610885 RepID=UPI002E3776DD|nr:MULTISPECIES: DUF4124 domain-containing protein [unclassified Francisella]MED7820082.1 DUF4124 domain-containing protein [Francisella sp. 19S2-4]MED7830902.1 DUF4124 domain-containing protein [Francisella sp. 19S2-10]